MRLIKMFGLAAIAAMAAMAFVGATSASAFNTQLCNSHSELICEEGQTATTVSMVNQGSGRLLSSLVDVICDDINATGAPLTLGAPQQVHVSELDFESCETGGEDECEVSVLEQPLANLLMTGLDAGTLTLTNGQALVECEDVFLGVDIHCIYDSTGLEFPVGSQHLTAENTGVDFVGGSFLCPDESFLDGLLVTTANRFVLAVAGPTALCKTHTAEKCPDKDLVKDVHFVAKNTGWLFSLKNDVKCEESLLKGTVVGGLAFGGQVITVEELTWKNCKLNGVDKCTVATVKPKTWAIGWEKLNLGVALVGSEVGVECGDIIDCKVIPASWKIEGAIWAHKGKISVSVNLAIDKGGTKCPGPIIWSASYESLDDVYVLK